MVCRPDDIYHFTQNPINDIQHNDLGDPSRQGTTRIKFHLQVNIYKQQYINRIVQGLIRFNQLFRLMYCLTNLGYLSVAICPSNHKAT